MFLSEDVKENPGTLALTVAWVVVFVALQWVQWREPAPASSSTIYDPLPVSTTTSHRFGDMTWLEVRRGDAWRLVTATFVHFGLVHLALNALALINLGRLVEPWYRTGPFLAICLAIGGLGNLIGGALRQFVGLARPWLASTAVAFHLPQRVRAVLARGARDPRQHPHRRRLDDPARLDDPGRRGRLALQDQGRRSPSKTDALVPRVDGPPGGRDVSTGRQLWPPRRRDRRRLDRPARPPLVRFSASRGFRWVSWASVGLVGIACVGIAIREDRDEADLSRQRLEIARRVVLDDGLRRDLEELSVLYFKRVVRSSALLDPSSEIDAMAVVQLLQGVPHPSLPRTSPPEQLAKERADLEALLDRLEKTPLDLWGPQVAEDLATLRDLARSSLETPIAYQDVYHFLIAWKPALKGIGLDLVIWNERGIALERAARKTL